MAPDQVEHRSGGSEHHLEARRIDGIDGPSSCLCRAFDDPRLIDKDLGLYGFR